MKKKKTYRDTGKTTFASLRAKYGLPDTIKGASQLRYKHPPEKGIYWYKVSEFVRRRDVEKYGTCISCSKPITFETCQAGHFAPASDCGLDLLFNLTNVNAECSHCNAWDEMHLFGYAENLDLRYGLGTAERLLNIRECSKKRIPYPNGEMPRIRDWTAKEYEQKILELSSLQI